MSRLREEMQALTESPHMLVDEVRRLARVSGLELEVGHSLAEALTVAEAYVDSVEFEELDEGLRDAWRWALGKMWKLAKATTKVSAKAVAATFVLPALAGPYLLAKGSQGAARGIKKALKKLNAPPEGGSGELLRGDEPFTIGDIAFHPLSQNRWRAMLPGRYEMIVKYKPNVAAFTAEVEGRKLGNYWNEDDLSYAVHVALAAIADEPS